MLIPEKTTEKTVDSGAGNGIYYTYKFNHTATG